MNGTPEERGPGSPLKLLTDKLDEIVSGMADVKQCTEAAKADFSKQNTETRKAITNALKKTTVVRIWAVGKVTVLVTAVLLALFGLAWAGLQYTGQFHVVFGPTAGACASRPVQQTNGGWACWVTPPADDEAAARLEVCHGQSLTASFEDKSHPNQGRRFCWLGPRREPAP